MEKQPMGYKQLHEIEMNLDKLRIDFGQKEVDLRSDIWRSRMHKFFKKDEATSKDNLVCSDLLRYWLEEAQELELTKEDYCEKLNEIVEEIDKVHNALKHCSTEGQMNKVISYATTVITDKLSFEDIKKQMAPKLKPDIGNTVGSFAALEQLKSFMAKRQKEKENTADGDVQMDDAQVALIEAEDAEMENHGPIGEPEQTDTKPENTKAKQKKGKSSPKKRVAKAEEKKQVPSKKIQEMKSKL